MHIVTKSIASVVALALLAGCSTWHKKYAADGQRLQSDQEKIAVEAYLFDARLRRKGKPTSFRLEVFQTDSVVALGGRAYLGKGALKGRLTSDSLEVYFPSSNEYLYETIRELFLTAECSQAPIELNLLHLFTSLPDSTEAMENIRIATNYDNSERPRFLIFLPDCHWHLELTYERQETGWRIRKIDFDNGRDVSFKATKRTYKKKVQIPLSKFRLVAPDGATRIIP